MMRLMVPCPLASSTFNETSVAAGAMPAFNPFESKPLPAMVPATCEPCPLSSYGSVRPLTKSTNFATRWLPYGKIFVSDPRRSSWYAIPESMIAMPTPAPLRPYEFRTRPPVVTEVR